MKLVLVHYHLNRGGVSQVIVNHLRALDCVLAQPLQVLVLSGPRALGWPADLAEQLERISLRRVTLPGLDYEELATGAQRRRLLRDVEQLLQEHGFRPEETVLHVHNHSLGKNTILPRLVLYLARAGFRLLLHIHDFAEDCRPENYVRLRQSVSEIEPADSGVRWSYPQAPHIHYAVLNDRDLGILQRAGVPSERLHLLPNPVLVPHLQADRHQARKKLQQRFGLSPQAPFLLYPVRGIRRKNLGEMLLWSLTAPEGGAVGITLAPLNPAEQHRYRFCVQQARALHLPVVFECGESGGLSFAENLAAADWLLNTSVAEGFGMVFLESALFGRELRGRDLPEITRSFTIAGVRWPRLASEVKVCSQWFDHRLWQSQVLEAYRQMVQPYELDPSAVFPDWEARLLQKFPPNGWGDFADLAPQGQQQVLARLVEAPGELQEFKQRNSSMTWEPGCNEAIAQAAKAVRQCYSLEPSGRRLLAMYSAVLGAAAEEPVPLGQAERILVDFLAPDRFRLIRM